LFEVLEEHSTTRLELVIEQLRLALRPIEQPGCHVERTYRKARLPIRKREPFENASL
jgi:hypothetical protein